MAFTIHWFPYDRDIQQLDAIESTKYAYSTRMNPTYDPAFFLPLAACLLKDHAENLDIHRFIESNLLGLAVMSLASNHICTRQAGHFILSTAYSLIDGSTLKGRNQIMLLLSYLRNSIPVEDKNEIKALPSLITSFVAQSLMILLKSESDMYPVINTFILQRPLLDLEDIPLFYSLFYSNSQDSKNERIWMLRLLKNGLNNVMDFQIFQRRHVCEILLTFYSSGFSDHQTRKLILEILFKASTIPSVISSMVT
jgi:hypothetical protein